MTASLRALLEGSIDDASLLSPAKPPFAAAVRRYAETRRAPTSWMLSRFVLPAARLADLAPHREALLAARAPLGVAAIGRGGDHAAALVEGLERDLEDIAQFLGVWGALAVVDALEVKLPTPLLDPPLVPALEDLIASVAQRFAKPAAPALTVYYEGVQGPDWRRALAAVISALAQGRGATRAGLKLRCGGLDPAAIPPVEHVAGAIAGCRDAGILFKATAGLHQPVRRLDHALMAKAHGFLNVFTAAALAHARQLDEPTLRQVVADEDVRAFAFEPAVLRWRDQSVTVAEIARARADFCTAFGSCGLEGLWAELRALGLL